jgi:hypothetical protein
VHEVILADDVILHQHLKTIVEGSGIGRPQLFDTVSKRTIFAVGARRILVAHRGLELRESARIR